MRIETFGTVSQDAGREQAGRGRELADGFSKR